MTPLRRRDEGAALVSVMLVMLVLGAITATITTLTLNNTQNASLDRQAAAALNVTEGGVAQAVEYLRSRGTGAIGCTSANPTPCAGNAWAAPPGADVVLPNGDVTKVWIEAAPVTRVNASGQTEVVSTHRIHSTGTSGGSPGKRKIDLDVKVRPFDFPLGIYTDKFIGGGNARILRESLYSKDCIYGRSGFDFGNSTDVFTGLPAAAHSTKWITNGNSCAQSPTSGSYNRNQDNIHDPRGPGVCNPDFPYDQDAEGSLTPPAPCNSGTYLGKSKFDDGDLARLGYKSRGLTRSQYDLLKARAQSMGQLYTVANNNSGCNGTQQAGFVAPDNRVYPQAVIYFDLTATGGCVSLQGSDFPAPYKYYGRPTADANCDPRSVVIVVEGGDLRIESGTTIVGSLFVPDGTYHGAGGAQIIGTLFAKQINRLTGTQDFMLDECFKANPPGGVLDVRGVRYREVDQ